MPNGFDRRRADGGTKDPLHCWQNRNREHTNRPLYAVFPQRYAGLLAARFKVPNAGTLQDEELLEDIGRRRGALLGRGKVNLQKAAEIVIFEFRAATLGRITLETPEEFLAWTAEGEAAEAARLARQKDRKNNKKASAVNPPVDPV